MDDLAAFLRVGWPDREVEVRGLAPFGDGHSGFTYTVDVGWETPLVLRLSPPGARIAGPSDIGRQGRIMAALHSAGLPAPRVVASSSEPAVNGRSFALMEFVDGMAWDTALRRSDGRQIAGQAIDVLHRLTRLQAGETGIGSETPISPLEELERWARVMTRAPEFLHGPALALHALLEDSAVAPGATALVHGDFHLANLIFGDGRVIAVVDWEIATLGQPLLDLGSLAVATLRRRYAPDPNPTGEIGVSIRELVDLYAVEEQDTASKSCVWFVALSCFKYAAILGYNLGLHRAGKRLDPLYEELLRTMAGLLDDGVLILREGLDSVDVPIPAGVS